MSGEPPEHPLSPPLRERGAAWPWILGFTLLVITPVAFLATGPEVSRWKLAQAFDAFEQGEDSRAEGLLNEALAWDPSNRAVELARAQRQADLKNYHEALELLQKASKAGARIPLNLKMELLLKTGHVEEAVEIFTPFVKAARRAESETHFELLQAAYRRELATYLNSQAYMRVVGNLDLDKAEEQIEEALGYVPASSTLKTDIQSRTAMLDTRGFLRWRKGTYDGALSDLNESVKLAEEELEKNLKPEKNVGRDALTSADYRRELERLKKPVAVIVYHRALVHQSRGEKEQAEKDLARVRELGFEPGDDLF